VWDVRVFWSLLGKVMRKELNRNLILKDYKVLMSETLRPMQKGTEVRGVKLQRNHVQVVGVLDNQIIEAEKLQCGGIIDSVCEAVLDTPVRCRGKVLVAKGALEGNLLEVLHIDRNGNVIDIQYGGGGWRYIRDQEPNVQREVVVGLSPQKNILTHLDTDLADLAKWNTCVQKVVLGIFILNGGSISQRLEVHLEKRDHSLTGKVGGDGRCHVCFMKKLEDE
jgi:hypothetical protein